MIHILLVVALISLVLHFSCTLFVAGAPFKSPNNTSA
jgi:hypothetical protein